MRPNTPGTDPASTASPEYITLTRSQVSRTSPKLCEMYNMDVPNSAEIRRIKSTIPASTVTSSAVVGSSSSSSWGFDSSAMAMTIRCCWPPEIW